MYTENSLFFPFQAAGTLRSQRGPQWQALVERVITLPDTHEEALAFVLMMIRLNGCTSCETDSFRAMRGCALCATQTLRRYKGTDEDLLIAYEKALAEVRSFALTDPRYTAIIGKPSSPPSIRAVGA